MMVDFARAKLFHIPKIEEFQNGGILCPLLKTLIASLLQYLPQWRETLWAVITIWFVKYGRYCWMLS
jgi:hypothetical protein